MSTWTCVGPFSLRDGLKPELPGATIVLLPFCMSDYLKMFISKLLTGINALFRAGSNDCLNSSAESRICCEARFPPLLPSGFVSPKWSESLQVGAQS